MNMKRPAGRMPGGLLMCRENAYIALPTTLNLSLIWLPRKMGAGTAPVAMRARISAYPASPWPASDLRDLAPHAASRAFMVHLLSEEMVPKMTRPPNSLWSVGGLDQR